MTMADVTSFNTLPRAAAVEELLACCAAPSWAEAVVDGRPYASVDELLERADGVLAAVPEEELEHAVASHPRIGERTDDARSLREQSGAAAAGVETQHALTAGNAEYERRFGRVFLISATGLSGEQILTALLARLDNDPEGERAAVRAELRKITRLRLRKLVS